MQNGSTGSRIFLIAGLILSLLISIPSSALGQADQNGTGSDKYLTDAVSVPDNFEITVFASPPEVNYPACLTVSPSGHVFVGVDKQGSLGKKDDRGKIVHSVDTDGDGRADRINTFARVEHPRGLFYHGGTLWVLHETKLSRFHDTNRDGVADQQEELVTGLGTKYVEKRGADHTTNGIRMGIDGWIYIAVGDFGIHEAKTADGETFTKRGGGILRVRPDGTELNVYTWGTRNIYDVAIDPYMNLFTRGNTNDGKGWNVRVLHHIQTANYGYPALYKHFPGEIMPPLGQYGAGSGAGALYLHDERWPSPHGNALYTCDWGLNRVFLHNIKPDGPTFKPHQTPFMKIQKPTDVDVDGTGRMFVSSWRNGRFSYSGPDVGYVAQVKPASHDPRPFPDLENAPDQKLVNALSSSTGRLRLHAQRELLKRGTGNGRIDQIKSLLHKADAPAYGRMAAMYTLKQLAGADAHPVLLALARETTSATIKAQAFRALTDRKTQLDNVPAAPLIKALESDRPEVRAQAVISLSRLDHKQSASDILPLTKRTDGSMPTNAPVHTRPDPGRVIPHLAVRALVQLDASEVCLEAIGGPYTSGALQALRYIHKNEVVKGLIDRLERTTKNALRKKLLVVLMRLYYREKEYDGSWWGTRPDNTDPYSDPVTWSASPRIARVLQDALSDAEGSQKTFLKSRMKRHDINPAKLPARK